MTIEINKKDAEIVIAAIRRAAEFPEAALGPVATVYTGGHWVRVATWGGKVAIEAVDEEPVGEIPS